MTHDRLKAGRVKAGLTQIEAAERLGISQPYLSQLEKGERPVTLELARLTATVYRLPPTALPIPEAAADEAIDPDLLARQLAGLGYPGFAHLRARKANPAAVILTALLQKDLETRLAEALPWVLLTYPDLDWSWLISQVKISDTQNRLGFLVAVAKNLAGRRLSSSGRLNCNWSVPVWCARTHSAATPCQPPSAVGSRQIVRLLHGTGTCLPA
jgi:transcriptional regulator with XRE-family HTH domain